MTSETLIRSAFPPAQTADEVCDLSCFFQPRRVAVVGASRTPGKLGHNVLKNLLQGGYKGEVIVINSQGEEVLGKPGYTSVNAYAAAHPLDPIDCAFLAVPAAVAVSAVDACAGSGVRAVVVGASGFAELGTDGGWALQQALQACIQSSSMRVIGPNTNGLLSVHDQLSLGYNASHADTFAPGGVSVVSHSGALFDGVARRLRDAGAGLAKFVPVGNEIDIDMLDVLAYLTDDPQTRVIGLVMEGLRDGDRFIRLCQQAHERGKPVVALKVGRSAKGLQATLAHSSRLSGQARSYDALMAVAGVSAVQTVEALAGTCALLARMQQDPPQVLRDARWVAVTTSGAGGALLADFADAHGLALVGDEKGHWPASVAQAIAQLPTAARIVHPIDAGSLGDWGLLEPTLQILEKDGMVGPMVVYAHIAVTPAMAFQLAQAVVQRRSRCAEPVAVLAPGGLTEVVEAVYLAGGVPVFRDAVNCFECLRLAAVTPGPPDSSPARPPSPAPAHPDIRRTLMQAQFDWLDESHSSRLLTLAGLPMVPSLSVNEGSAAEAAALHWGFPVVLKALVTGVAHKHDAGLVITGIGDLKSLRQAWQQICARVQVLAGAEAAVHCLVQPQCPADLELILGVSHDSGVGHVMVFGLGGVFAEVLDRVEVVHLRASPNTLRSVLAQSQVGRLVARMDKTPDQQLLEQLTQALLSLQLFVLQHEDLIASVDVNPVRVHARGLMAVDALIERRLAASA